MNLIGLGILDVGIASPATGGAVPAVTPIYPPGEQPNPRGYVPAIELRTWLQAVKLNLIGQDRIFGAPGQTQTYDWPNPRGYVPAIELKTWLLSVNLNLLSQDNFFGAGGPNYQWPNPIPPRREIGLYTFFNTGPGLLHTSPTYGLGGYPNFNQPNPILPRRAVDLLTSLSPLPINPVIFTGAPGVVFSSEQSVYIVGASDSPSGQNWSGQGYMAKYDIDSTIQINGDFFNAVTGVYADPSGITLLVRDPTGAQLSYQYGVGGPIVRDSPGKYHYVITASKSGTWTYKWKATGSVVGTSPDTTFTINPSALIAG